MSTETSRAAPQHPSAVRCKESDNTPAASTPTITGCCAHSCRAQPGNPQSHLCPMTRHARGCTLLRNPGRGRRDLPHTCTVPAATLACFALRERTTHIHNQGGFPLCICCFPGWAEKGWVGGSSMSSPLLWTLEKMVLRGGRRAPAAAAAKAAMCVGWGALAELPALSRLELRQRCRQRQVRARAGVTAFCHELLRSVRMHDMLAGMQLRCQAHHGPLPAANPALSGQGTAGTVKGCTALSITAVMCTPACHLRKRMHAQLHPATP